MLQLDGRKGVPIYEQVVWQVKELCLRGVLRPGEKLPSVRELSGTIVANPNTVAKAYQELERLGVLETQPGKGTFVAERPPVVRDAARTDHLRRQLRQLVVDAIYGGIRLDELEGWLRQEFAELGGDGHA